MLSRDLTAACSTIRAVADKIRHEYEDLHPGIRASVIGVERSAEEQRALYAQGRTEPGKIVTKLDGYTKKSPHQKQLVHGEDAVHAIDFGLFDPDGVYLTGEGRGPRGEYEIGLYGALGPLVKKYGLFWGGTLWFPTFVDRPHVQCLRRF